MDRINRGLLFFLNFVANFDSLDLARLDFFIDR